MILITVYNIIMSTAFYSVMRSWFVSTGLIFLIKYPLDLILYSTSVFYIFLLLILFYAYTRNISSFYFLVLLSLPTLLMDLNSSYRDWDYHAKAKTWRSWSGCRENGWDYGRYQYLYRLDVQSQRQSLQHKIEDLKSDSCYHGLYSVAHWWDRPNACQVSRLHVGRCVESGGPKSFAIYWSLIW
jgi:hypothetical protein